MLGAAPDPSADRDTLSPARLPSGIIAAASPSARTPERLRNVAIQVETFVLRIQRSRAQTLCYD
jgi:hypothetical protein